ncbi:uncharacterized protein LOC122322924 [Puntigrus tetrazona]|uniref:uncharacterized protein LOC122322924 n=1 Tax=Puntigrus tetrazona TaxID=1606681 RepID=UPI001C8AF16C|nr:uncharacterized protein LOC122322924 [Puntigrus tetrazona]
MKYKSCHVRTVLYSYRENYRLHSFYVMEFSISPVSALILLWACLGVKSKTEADGDLDDRISPVKRLLVRPENSVDVHPGQELTLRCGAEGDGALERSWQTPFGPFDGCDHRNKDPVDACNGSLRISRATSSHDGLYYCVRLDETSKTVLPYRVKVLEEEGTVSESRFAAAVASSVIVSFAVAFTLGACTGSYVMKCLRSMRARVPHRKDTRIPARKVFFLNDRTGGEHTADIGALDVVSEDAAGHESNEPRAHEGDQPTLGPHTKKRVRVIKVYNYDEEGNPYGHIRETGTEREDRVGPRMRTRSLTRLDAIMKRAEALDGPAFPPDAGQTDRETHL